MIVLYHADIIIRPFRIFPLPLLLLWALYGFVNVVHAEQYAIGGILPLSPLNRNAIELGMCPYRQN